MTQPIKWVEKTVPIISLKLNKNNPRRISKEQFARLKKSIAETGYHHRILVTKSGDVIGGHQRIRALREIGENTVIVLMADRDLTQDEYQRVLIQDNVSFGEFDMDILANDFMPRDLTEWGFPDFKTDLAEAPVKLDADQKADEQSDKHNHTCPSCGLVF